MARESVLFTIDPSITADMVPCLSFGNGSNYLERWQSWLHPILTVGHDSKQNVGIRESNIV
jgi:hypothetical protein